MCESDSRVSELERKIKDGSKCFEDYKLLAEIYNKREEYEKLLILIEKIFNLPIKNKERAITFAFKGIALRSVGNKEEFSCYEQSMRLLENEKESSEILYTKGYNHYSLSHDTDNESRDEHGRQALEIFRKLSRKDADYQSYMVNYCLGVLYARINKFSEAIEAFNKAIEMSENNTEKVSCLSEIAIVYSDQGDYSKSEKTFERIFRMTDDNKDYSILYYEMGMMYFNSNSNGKAIDAFNNALRYIEFVPFLVKHKNYIAKIYWCLGTLAYGYNNDVDKAIKHFNKALENISEDHTDFCDVHITLGHCYLVKKDYDIAMSCYNKVLSAPLVTDSEKDFAMECLKEVGKRKKDAGIGSFFSKFIRNNK
jgi:tetratricopeptide (TPR) repeat protein